MSEGRKTLYRDSPRNNVVRPPDTFSLPDYALPSPFVPLRDSRRQFRTRTKPRCTSTAKSIARNARTANRLAGWRAVPKSFAAKDVTARQTPANLPALAGKLWRAIPLPRRSSSSSNHRRRRSRSSQTGWLPKSAASRMQGGRIACNRESRL